MIKRARRWPSDAVVGLDAGDGFARGRVSDVSVGGMKVSAPGLHAAVGMPVRLTVQGVAARGTVLWRKGGSYGLLFRPELDADLLAILTDGLSLRVAGREGGTTHHWNMHTL